MECGYSREGVRILVTTCFHTVVSAWVTTMVRPCDLAWSKICMCRLANYYGNCHGQHVGKTAKTDLGSALLRRGNIALIQDLRYMCLGVCKCMPWTDLVGRKPLPRRGQTIVAVKVRGSIGCLRRGKEGEGLKEKHSKREETEMTKKP